jgi:hypothetical protein
MRAVRYLTLLPHRKDSDESKGTYEDTSRTHARWRTITLPTALATTRAGNVRHTSILELAMRLSRVVREAKELGVGGAVALSPGDSHLTERVEHVHVPEEGHAEDHVELVIAVERDRLECTRASLGQIVLTKGEDDVERVDGNRDAAELERHVDLCVAGEDPDVVGRVVLGTFGARVDRVDHRLGQLGKGEAVVEDGGELRRVRRRRYGRSGESHRLSVHLKAVSIEESLPVLVFGQIRSCHHKLRLLEYGLVARQDLSDGELARERMRGIISGTAEPER